MQTARVIELLQSRAAWAIAALIVIGVVASVASRRKGVGSPGKSGTGNHSGGRRPPDSNDKPAKPESAEAKNAATAPFSQEEALREFAAHAKALEGCYEDLWQALDSGDADALRRKLSAVATRFRNLKSAPRAQVWFGRIAGNLNVADAEQLTRSTREFFAALESIGIRRCPDKTVPDNDETLERYVFVGSGHPVGGGPYKVVRPAWLLDGRKVVEQGFFDNENGDA